MAISVTVSTEVQKDITQSLYLLEMQLNKSTLRYSSSGNVRLFDLDFIEGDFNRPTLSTDTNGQLNGSIEFGNADLAISSLILREGIRGKKLKVWQVFGASPYLENNAVCVFDGYMDNALRVGNLSWRIMLKGASGNLSLVPHHVIAPPLCHHLPEDGKVIQWNNQVITLETKR